MVGPSVNAITKRFHDNKVETLIEALNHMGFIRVRRDHDIDTAGTIRNNIEERIDILRFDAIEYVTETDRGERTSVEVYFTNAPGCIAFEFSGREAEAILQYLRQEAREADTRPYELSYEKKNVLYSRHSLLPR